MVQELISCWQVTDNVDVSPIVKRVGEEKPFPLGQTLVTYIATDGAGNEAKCTLTVTVWKQGNGLSIFHCDGSEVTRLHSSGSV